jgi:hypothetical protein
MLTLIASMFGKGNASMLELLLVNKEEQDV